MNIVYQGYRKLSSETHTDRHTDWQTWLKLYTTPLRGWSKSAIERFIPNQQKKSRCFMHQKIIQIEFF